MDYDLSEEQKILRKTVRDFAEKEIQPVAADLDEKQSFSYDIVDKMGNIGIMGIPIPEEYGGGGADYVSYIIAVEELARVDASSAITMCAHTSLGTMPIYYYGTEEQKQEWLPKLTSGGMLASFGLTEPNAGSDAGATNTTANLQGNNWIINGSKCFITNAGTKISGIVTITAKTGSRKDGRSEIECILIPKETEGYNIGSHYQKMGWRWSDTRELSFVDCCVPKENLLGEKGHGLRQMLEILDGGRLSVGAMGLGGAQGAFEMALKYSKERFQFGKPISSFQVNAFKLSDMLTEIEMARLLLYKATWLKDRDKPFIREAAMAKLVCSETMGRVVNQALQLHGGYGYMKEYPIERFYRDQKVLDIAEGTSEIQRIVISRTIGC
ncbi:MAG: acyl-CoA dehydrogenase family protein [Thermodesulfobacteriota bacterium]|nr:acyl-CoA dehydrogenase family protein [Thermodesulfobacteriota bacterium]